MKENTCELSNLKLHFSNHKLNYKCKIRKRKTFVKNLADNGLLSFMHEEFFKIILII